MVYTISTHAGCEPAKDFTCHFINNNNPPPYGAMGETSAGRVKTLLDKLDSARRSKDRGYEISDQASMTSHKFMGRVWRRGDIL